MDPVFWIELVRETNAKIDQLEQPETPNLTVGEYYNKYLK